MHRTVLGEQPTAPACVGAYGTDPTHLRMSAGRDARRALVPVALVFVLWVIAGCGGGGASQGETDRAVTAAKKAYAQAKAAGVDLEPGPCIAEWLPGVPGWVADVAHDPREDVDDDPANQCQSYRDGEADHFVELTPEGELIRAE